MVYFLHLKYIEAIRPKYIEVGSESESPASPAYGYARYGRLLNISVKQTFINLRPLGYNMSQIRKLTPTEIMSEANQILGQFMTTWNTDTIERAFQLQDEVEDNKESRCVWSLWEKIDWAMVEIEECLVSALIMLEDLQLQNE